MDPCEHCGGNEYGVDHVAGERVCRDCGLVVAGSNMEFALPESSYPTRVVAKPHRHHKQPRVSMEARRFVLQAEKSRSAPYQPMVYVRELFRLFTGKEPPIPLIDFIVIRTKYQQLFPTTPFLTKDDVREILHAVDVDRKRVNQSVYFVRKYLVSMLRSSCVTMIHRGV